MTPASENRCGLSPETISKHLKTTSYVDQKIRATRAKVDQEPECCSICLEDLYQKDEATAKLECGHEYHIDCIKLWIQKKNICPICRTKALPVKENHDTSSFIVLQINDGVTGQGGADRGGILVEIGRFILPHVPFLAVMLMMSILGAACFFYASLHSPST